MAPKTALRSVLRPLLAAALVLALPVAALAQEDDSDIGKPEKAVKTYRKAVEKAPDDADSWYNLGLALILLERWDEAVPATQRAVELNPESPRAQFRAGEALAGAGRDADALPYFRKAAELDDTMVPAHLRLAQAAMNAGQTEDAVAALKNALRAKPEDPTPIYAMMGEAYLRGHDPENAVKWLERTLDKNPDDPAANFNLAVTMRQAGKSNPELMKQAADRFKRAADLDPKDPAAQFYAGETLVWVQRNAEARPYLERYLALDPDGSKLSAETNQAAHEYLQMIGG